MVGGGISSIGGISLGTSGAGPGSQLGTPIIGMSNATASSSGVSHAGLQATTSTAEPGALSAANGQRLQQLLQLIEGFTSAEILMGLMLAAAAGKKEEEEQGGSALALLAGMAMASQLGQGLSQLMDANRINCSELGGGGLGLNLNIQA